MGHGVAKKVKVNLEPAKGTTGNGASGHSSPQ